MASEPIRVLLVEDNPTDRGIIQQALASEKGSQFAVQLADRLSVALKHLQAGGIHLVLLDLQLPDSEGLETLLAVRDHAPQVPIVILTASDDEALAAQMLQHGAQDYLVKGYVQVYRNLLGRSMRYAIERKRAEEEIRNAYARTDQLLASIPSILIGVDPNGRITHWNTVAEMTFGIPASQVLGRPLVESGIHWDAQQILDRIAVCRRTNAPDALDDMPFQRPNGDEGSVGITIMPIRRPDEQDAGMLIFGADVTQRKQAELERGRLQEQLMQAQKLETVGRFAGGIAHDFNNFLQIILGFIWLIRARQYQDQALLSDLQQITHAAESASGMVRQLLAFSRRQPLQLKALEVNQTVRNMIRLLQQLVGERIQVRLELSANPLVVKLDPTWVEQILLNLCANARDSMPQGGILTIRTQRVTVDEAFLKRRPWWTTKGIFVQLSIQDTGSGMDPEAAAHIFEPFFTTKQSGKGTGLGLAVVYGLVRQHEGVIDVETALGQGTTLHLYFPAQDVPAEEVVVLPEPALAQTTAPVSAGTVSDGVAATSGRTEKKRVLVVDDNAPILVLCQRILKDAYDVTTVSSAREALEALKRQPYDLLLTDLRMPNMDGVALLNEVSKHESRPKLLAMTGSITDEMAKWLGSVPLSEKVIRKPFTAPILLGAITRCLS